MSSKLSKWLDFRKPIPIHHSHGGMSPFFNFQQDMDNLLQNFYRYFPLPTTEFSNLNLNPFCDVVEDDKNFKVEVEMPGVDEKDISVAINDGILTICASKETSKKDDGKNYVMREISYGAYERSITLPDNADVDEAESTFKKGMLWVNIPKKAIDSSKKRELEVKKAAE